MRKTSSPDSGYQLQYWNAYAEYKVDRAKSTMRGIGHDLPCFCLDSPNFYEQLLTDIQNVRSRDDVINWVNERGFLTREDNHASTNIGIFLQRAESIKWLFRLNEALRQSEQGQTAALEELAAFEGAPNENFQEFKIKDEFRELIEKVITDDHAWIAEWIRVNSEFGAERMVQRLKTLFRDRKSSDSIDIDSDLFDPEFLRNRLEYWNRSQNRIVISFPLLEENRHFKHPFVFTEDASDSHRTELTFTWSRDEYGQSPDLFLRYAARYVICNAVTSMLSGIELTISWDDSKQELKLRPAYSITTPWQALGLALMKYTCGESISPKRCRNPNCLALIVGGRADKQHCERSACRQWAYRNLGGVRLKSK